MNYTVFLLQINMMNSGTHLVRNHESQSRTNESQLKKMSPKWQMFGPLCTSRRQLI